VNHSKIAICVSVMNEEQFLFASKPCKPLKPRFLGGCAYFLLPLNLFVVLVIACVASFYAHVFFDNTSTPRKVAVMRKARSVFAIECLN
jgi:hypothetical protein